ncbi:MAG: translocation protein S66 [Bathelium mastoideum]|nr:MAG: translocation protein S66 [Bathelium mastoideum]
MVDWVSLAIPFAYLGVLIGSLATFSSLYRKRKASRALSLAPWFPPHLQRNIYLSLLHIEDSPAQQTANAAAEKPAKVPDSVLKAALLRRATEDIHRIIQVRTAKQALSTLLQRGSVGDDLWQQFLRAEKEIEAELKDVVQEANAFAENWGQTIFQSASEMANNQIMRKRLDEIQSQVSAEKEWWEKRKATIQSDFMKELDDDAKVKDEKDKSERKSSDDDAVLVESGGPASAPGGGQGKAGKKKGKK